MLGDQIKEGAFTCEIELEAKGDCTNLCFRVPIAGATTPIDGLTISEILIKYL